MELISIIIPIYNIERYLSRCLDSILNQSYQNYEVIMVDDGSIDNSYLVCLEYAKKDNRFIPVKQENGGASKARNAGLEKANGGVIAFVDGDDFLHKDYLKMLLDKMLEKNTYISMCGLECVDEEGKEVPSPFRRNEVPRKITGDKAVTEIGNNVVYGVVWNKLYRKELFKDIRFTEGMTFEDEMILHHLYGKADQIACVQETLYYYVQRSSSKMKESYSEAKMDIIIAYMDRLLYEVENNYPIEAMNKLNQKLINDFFRTAVVRGRKTVAGKEKFVRLYKYYCKEIYPQLDASIKNFWIKWFVLFPVSFGYGKTIVQRIIRNYSNPK